MKNQRFFRFIVLSAVLVLISSGLFFAGDPVPGLDITIEQIPGGKKISGTTNSSGEVTFNNLRPGDYRITFVRKRPGGIKYEKQGGTVNPLGKNYNSSISNSSSTLAKGRTEWEVNITLIYDGGPKSPDAPIEVTIGPKGGKITIRVDQEVAIKEEGVK
ncbi:MAG: carboxypeptidase-like regulatory domain-containing protein [Melioribacteraceae bacterium]